MLYKQLVIACGDDTVIPLIMTIFLLAWCDHHAVLMAHFDLRLVSA